MSAHASSKAAHSSSVRKTNTYPLEARSISEPVVNKAAAAAANLLAALYFGRFSTYTSSGPTQTLYCVQPS